MNIVASSSISVEAKRKLENYGKLILFETSGIVYEAVSKHPDIFLCPMEGKLIASANLPDTYRNLLLSKGIHLISGSKALSHEYPQTAFYNVVVTDDFIIGNEKFMDKSIIDNAKGRTIIHVNQGYTRCNLIPLSNNRFITSDKGILKQLEKKNLKVLYVQPMGIILDGFSNGFFGGCCGVNGNRLFINGNLNHFPQGKEVKNFVGNMEIIELNTAPLTDIGSILFL